MTSSSPTERHVVFDSYNDHCAASSSQTSVSSSKSPGDLLAQYGGVRDSLQQPSPPPNYQIALTNNNTNTNQQQQQYSIATASMYSSSPWTLGSTSGPAPNGGGGGESKHAGDGGGDDNTSVPEIINTTTPTSRSTGGAVIAASSGKASQQSQFVVVQEQQSLYQDRLFRQASASVEAVLAAACEVMGFDIAEMWLRTGPKTHQLTNSHLRPTALEDSVRQDIVDVYYGQKSSERTHRLSPALCKRAKEAGDVIWVTAHNPSGADILRCSISNVRTAVAVPVCHEASHTNITVIFFSIRRIIIKPTSVEFLLHMSLAAGVAAVNSLAEDGLMDAQLLSNADSLLNGAHLRRSSELLPQSLSKSEHIPINGSGDDGGRYATIRHQQVGKVSVTGAQLDLQWRQLENVEYLTDGGNSWIHTAVFNGKPVVVKTLKPECQDVVLAINEIEGELSVHSRLNHENIVSLIGAGTTSKGVRFFVLERLDGGTLTQMLGYDTRIRDRRRRFWRRKHFSFLDVLRIAKAMAEAMTYLHEEAIPGCVVLHRDLKPDNIGFTLDGTVKILDFGLAKIIENASVESGQTYVMSGETGSLRYMSPEVAEGLPYNYSADVYSFGIILWELSASKKPFEGLNRDLFYERIVHGGERPPLNRKWPRELCNLMAECWDVDLQHRPTFRDIVRRLDTMLEKEKGVLSPPKRKQFLPKISGMIDRHSTWF